MIKSLKNPDECLDITFPFELDPNNVKIQASREQGDSDKYIITVTINGPFTADQRDMLDGLMSGINDELLRPISKETLAN